MATRSGQRGVGMGMKRSRRPLVWPRWKRKSSLPRLTASTDTLRRAEASASSASARSFSRRSAGLDSSSCSVAGEMEERQRLGS